MTVSALSFHCWAALNTNIDPAFRAELVPVDISYLPGTVMQMRALPTGDLLVAGYFSTCELPGMLRFKPDGKVDPNFSGVFTNNAYGFDIDSNGNIIVIGANRPYFDEIAKLRTDGSPDTNFTSPQFLRGSSGLDGNSIRDVKVFPDDSILISGNMIQTTFGPQPTLRLEPNGTIDLTWKDLFVTARCILAPGGKFYGFGDTVIRFLPDGSQDPDYHAPTFSSCGFIGCDLFLGLSTIALDSTGKLIVGGQFQVATSGLEKVRISTALVRLLEDGRLDTNFVPKLNWIGPVLPNNIGDFIMVNDNEFVVVGAGPYGARLALAGDGKIYVGSWGATPLVRYFGFFDPTRPPTLTLDQTGSALNVHLAGGRTEAVDIEHSADLESWEAIRSVTNYPGFATISIPSAEFVRSEFFRARER